MQAGLLNRRVELQHAVETRDPMGGTARTWTTIVRRWAQILPLRGQEKFDASQMDAQTNVKMRIRYYGGYVETIDDEEIQRPFNPTWRIVKGSTIYNIKSVINIGDRNYAQEIEVMETVE